LTASRSQLPAISSRPTADGFQLPAASKASAARNHRRIESHPESVIGYRTSDIGYRISDIGYRTSDVGPRSPHVPPEGGSYRIARVHFVTAATHSSYLFFAAFCRNTIFVPSTDHAGSSTFFVPSTCCFFPSLSMTARRPDELTYAIDA